MKATRPHLTGRVVSRDHIAGLGLPGCLAVSMLAFVAAVRVLDIHVRWWRMIAGLLLLRISNAVMTPGVPWVQQV